VPMALTETDVDGLDAALSAGAFLIDVREVDEYLSEHVPGAILVPLSELAGRLDECRNPDGGPTHLICKAGGRSANAGAMLASIGVEVVNVAGGTMAWVMSGREVVEGSNPQ